MIATSFASDTPIWVTEVTRQDGLQRMWWVIVSVLPLIIGIFLFSRLWRRSNIITDAQFFEFRYEGKPAALLRGVRACYGGILQNLLTIGWVTFGMSTVLEVLIPEIDQTQAIVALMVVALFYATFSGFYGVVATDVVQFFITMGSMFALACIAVNQSGGLESVLSEIRVNPDYGESTLSIFPDFSTFNSDVLKMLVIFTLVWWSDANGYNMQRISACRNERDAIRATLFYAIFQSCRPWLWVVVGLVSIAAFPALTEHSKAYPMVINEFLGVGLKGLLITAFLAAFMSTIDTHLNWGASFLTIDLYKRFLNKKASERHYVRASKWFMIILMVAGALIATQVESVSGVMEWLAYLMIPGGIASVLRWFWWRINAYTELTALIGGLIGGITFKLLDPATEVFGQAWGDLAWEFKVALLVGIVFPLSIVVTFLTQPVSTQKLVAFYRQVRPGGAWGPIRREVGPVSGSALNASSWLDVIGGVMLCYGLSLTIAYGILLNQTACLISLAVSCVGAMIVWVWYGKEVKRLSEDMQK
jgi:SSS family solute:Na+ symporter